MKKQKLIELSTYRNNSKFYFKTGMRYVDKRSFKTAKHYLEKAVEIEPFNADYQFNYACVLAELKDTEKSNNILINIIKNIDPTLRDCYFGIACNFFELGNFKLSKDYFEKYLYFDPEGQFIDEAHDILYYLQMYDEMEVNIKKGGVVPKLMSESKKLLENANFKKACEKLEKVIDINPELISPRNELSNVYFLTGFIDKAISLANSVLKLEADNIEANCNLAIYYFTAGNVVMYTNILKTLSTLKLTSNEELYLLVNTYIKTSNHDGLIKLLMKHSKEAKSPPLCFFLATAFYNTKQFEQSINIWDEIEKKHTEYKIITEYNREIVKQHKSANLQFNEIVYSQKLPMEIESQYLEKLDSWMNLEPEIFKEIWDTSENMKSVIQYFLFEGRPEVSNKLINILLKIRDKDINKILKKLISNSNISREAKKIIISVLDLKELDATGEVKSKSGTKTREIKLSDHIKWKSEWSDIIDCALEKKEFIYQQGYKSEIKNIWLNFVKKVKPENLPIIKDAGIWAAALEYIYCNLHLIHVSKKQLAKKYNISLTALVSSLKEFNL